LSRMYDIKNRMMRPGILAIIGMIVLAAGLGCSSRYLTLQEKLRLHDEEIEQSNRSGCIAGCVLFEGDSNMELINFQEYFTEPCCNYSRRGCTTEELLKRANEINNIKPDIIVMLVGGNDLLQHIPIGTIDKNYSRILSYFKTITKKIYCISNLPVQPDFYLKNQEIKNLNSVLKRICGIEGAVYIDVYPELMKNGGLNPVYARDPVHLNKPGQDLLVGVIKKYLKNK
jgi:hypothetical protein